MAEMSDNDFWNGIKQGHQASKLDDDSAVAAVRAKLVELRSLTRRLTADIDEIVARDTVIASVVRGAGEFAVNTEQTRAAREALDAASATAASVTARLGKISSTLADLEDQLDASADSLRPVEQAADSVRQSGAGLKATARARHDA